MKRLYDSPDHRATLDYCESGAYYDIQQPDVADLFEDYASRFPRIEAVDFINWQLDEAQLLDDSIREVRRRVRKPVAFVDAVTVASPIARLRGLLRDLGSAEFWRIDFENFLI